MGFSSCPTRLFSFRSSDLVFLALRSDPHPRCPPGRNTPLVLPGVTQHLGCSSAGLTIALTAILLPSESTFPLCRLSSGLSGSLFLFFPPLIPVEQIEPSLLSVVKSHKRFIRFQRIGCRTLSTESSCASGTCTPVIQNWGFCSNEGSSLLNVLRRRS